MQNIYMMKKTISNDIPCRLGQHAPGWIHVWADLALAFSLNSKIMQIQSFFRLYVPCGAIYFTNLDICPPPFLQILHPPLVHAITPKVMKSGWPIKTRLCVQTSCADLFPMGSKNNKKDCGCEGIYETEHTIRTPYHEACLHLYHSKQTKIWIDFP